MVASEPGKPDSLTYLSNRKRYLIKILNLNKPVFLINATPQIYNESTSFLLSQSVLWKAFAESTNKNESNQLVELKTQYE